MCNDFKDYFGELYDNAISIQPNTNDRVVVDYLFDMLWLNTKHEKRVFDSIVVVISELIDINDIEEFEQKCWEVWYASEEENNNV